MIVPPPTAVAPSPISSALDWLLGTLLGTAAMTVAIIAVAYVGFLMLAGRIEVRRAGTVVVGCFILFGASSIAAGIRSAVSAVNGGARKAQVPNFAAAPTFQATVPAIPPAPTAPVDPYAGAAVVPR